MQFYNKHKLAFKGRATLALSLLISMVLHLGMISAVGISFPGFFRAQRYSLAYLGNILLPLTTERTLPASLAGIKPKKLPVKQVLLPGELTGYQLAGSPQQGERAWIAVKPPAAMERRKVLAKAVPTVAYKRKAALHAEPEQVIMFHPLLPGAFALYFNDRAAVHIEMQYKESANGKKFVTVSRKISSGNLEADLLCMRYITRFLSFQKARNITDNEKWKTVKIDLSAKKNEP